MNNTALYKLSNNLVADYAAIFLEHQESVHKHLQGQLQGGQPLLPSYLPPASYWTSREKDLFFHGITIYSRLRPDLIAAHIKTKNTLDVCVYLDCLQTAALRESDEATSSYMTEPAMELSDDWVSREGMLAEATNSLESCFWSAGKDGIYAQPDCICPSIDADITTFPSTTNAYFNHLDSICLMTQESILHEASKLYDLDTSAKTFAAGEDPHNGEPSALASNHDYLGDARHNSSPLMTEEILKGALDHENCPVGDKKLQRLLKKRLYMRRKRAEQAGKAVVPASIKLRPGRPKKARKPSKPRPKNYNTKNRLGSESSSRVQSVDPEIATSQPQPESADLMDLHKEDLESTYEKHSQGGLTRPYRVKKTFQENGIDAQLLVDMGIDFFHLSTLTRLMRLYNSMSDPARPLDAVSISAPTIQLFADITREFVSEIIRRAVITKEQEVRLKRTMKVWKYEKDEITIENVAECLYSMGLGDLSKENYIALLFADQQNDISPTVSDHADINDAEEENHEEPNDDITKDQFYRTPQFTLPESMIWCSLPNHRTLFTGDDILPEEVDSEALEKELEEDEELNIQDEMISKDYESSLVWSTGR